MRILMLLFLVSQTSHLFGTESQRAELVGQDAPRVILGTSNAKSRQENAINKRIEKLYLDQAAREEEWGKYSEKMEFHSRKRRASRAQQRKELSPVVLALGLTLVSGLIWCGSKLKC